MGFPGHSGGRESENQCRIHKFNPWVWKIPWRRKRQPTPVFLPGESRGQGSLEGYRPWGHKESNRTEQLNNNMLNNIDIRVVAKNITRQTGIWILEVLFHRRTKQGILNKFVRAC